MNRSRGITLNRASNSAIYTLGDSISPMGEISDKCFIRSIYPITNSQADYLVSIGGGHFRFRIQWDDRMQRFQEASPCMNLQADGE